MNRKLVILYRCCNRELKQEEFNICRPNWFSKQKCFKSFYDNFINKENIEIVVVYDGEKNEELYKYIESFKDVKIIPINVRNNEKSLLTCYDLARTFDCQYLMFQEDDFLFLPNSYKILTEGFDLFIDKFDGFLTLYDHWDRYIRGDDLTRGQEYILATYSTHWRTSESTTCSWCTNKKTFDLIIDEAFKCGIQDRLFFRNCLDKYKLRLFNPIPALSTHVNKFFCSPYINWEKYNETINL